MCRTRTNIDLDDDLVAAVRERDDLPTKKRAVDVALRRLVGPVMGRSEMLAMEGSGWQGDATALREQPVETV